MDYETYHKKFLQQFNEKLNKDILADFRRARLIYTHENSSICPECGADTKLDLDHGEKYCTKCGLIVKSSIHYVGVIKIHSPYGTLLFG